MGPGSLSLPLPNLLELLSQAEPCPLSPGLLPTIPSLSSPPGSTGLSSLPDTFQELPPGPGSFLLPKVADPHVYLACWG